ncbi:hypothetical protein ES703_20075 [subsurface metagenome]
MTEIKNIFHLVGKYFEREEDKLSASFAFVLHLNRSNILKKFLDYLGLTINGIKDVNIMTQEPHQDSIIDLQIEHKPNFMVFIESKIWDNQFDEQQLRKYAKLLSKLKNEYKEVRLILITQMNEAYRFKEFSKKTELSRRELRYLRWNELLRMVEENNYIKDSKLVNKLFLEEFEMKDEKVIDEQKIGEINEVLVFIADPECLEDVLKHNRCAWGWDPSGKQRARLPSDAQYIAFYASHEPKMITHLAKVKSIKMNVGGGTLKGWYHSPRLLFKVFYLEKPIRLRNPIPVKGYRMQFGYRPTTFGKFINAKKVADLF